MEGLMALENPTHSSSKLFTREAKLQQVAQPTHGLADRERIARNRSKHALTCTNRLGMYQPMLTC
jgi:hypothetical protein